MARPRGKIVMKAYLRVFVNYEPNDWARLLVIAAKNESTGHTPFKLNCGYHPHVSFKEDIDPRSIFKSANELSTELQKLMTVYRKTFHHAQNQKQARNEAVKPKSYALGNKVWLNSKYIKTKQNCKLKAKFFGPFQVLHLIGNQA